MNIIIEASDPEGPTWGDLRAAVAIGDDHEDLDFVDFIHSPDNEAITGIRVRSATLPTAKPKPAMRGGYGPVEGDWRTTPQERGDAVLDAVPEPEFPRDPKPVSVTSF